MTEELLQFIWKYKLYRPHVLRTSDGECVEVIDPGQPNPDAGPDFFNAKIKIDQTLWAGSVEVHLKASDWSRHKHQVNTDYNNVILHVVLDNDGEAYNQLGRKIAALQIDTHALLLEQYKTLMLEHRWLVCKDGIDQMNPVELLNWLERLVIMKLESKHQSDLQILTEFNSNWDQLFFVLLSRAFGFGLNADAFESMARSIPVNILYKHADNQFQIEALLMGQAGLLGSESTAAYYLQLKAEYQFLKEKYKLNQFSGPHCKFLRLRPNNFPTIRLSQLANFICHQQGLFEPLLKKDNLVDYLSHIEINVSEYWGTHYVFGKENIKSDVKALGLKSKHLIIINAIVPFMFSYGKHKDNSTMQDKAVDLLFKLPPEKNRIVDDWKSFAPIEVKSAFDTQGVIFLKNSFCNSKKCLKCAIGHRVLNKIVN
jgi:hypothetical protein